MTNGLINWYGCNIALIGVINHDKRFPVASSACCKVLIPDAAPPIP